MIPSNVVKFVLNELTKVEHSVNNGNAIILCPFHQDSNPSFNVNIDDSKRRVPVGWGRCWSCGASKKWNDFAPLLGLRKLSKKNQEFESGYARRLEDNLRSKLLGESISWTIDDIATALDCGTYNLVDEKWRGYEPELLRKFNCQIALDKNDNKVLIIPVYINGALVGATKAFWTKPKSKKVPSYIHMKGGWVTPHGLFPYDYVESSLEYSEKNYVIIVEGVRDCLRLIKENEPALCIFGTNTWSDDKLKLIKLLGVDTLVIMMDSGKAGISATNTILKATKGKGLRRVVIRMRDYHKWYEKKKGKSIKEIDPHNAPRSVMKRILKEIESRV